MGLVMGFINRIKKAFSSKSEEEEVGEEEFHDPYQEAMAEAFVERQQSVIDDAMNELESSVQKAKSEIAPKAASEYDVGEVEVLELLSEEEDREDHSEMNVIEHLSVEEIGGHLDSARIEGDLPKEIKF